MILIELHSINEPIWVNPNYISSMCEGVYGGSNVFMANDANPVQVKESLKEILNLIQSALQ
jgi:hypothetical protein